MLQAMQAQQQELLQGVTGFSRQRDDLCSEQQATELQLEQLIVSMEQLSADADEVEQLQLQSE